MEPSPKSRMLYSCPLGMNCLDNTSLLAVVDEGNLAP